MQARNARIVLGTRAVSLLSLHFTPTVLYFLFLYISTRVLGVTFYPSPRAVDM